MSIVEPRVIELRDQAKILGQIHSYLHSSPQDRDLKNASWKYLNGVARVYKDRGNLNVCLVVGSTTVPLDIFIELSKITRELVTLCRETDFDEIKQLMESASKDRESLDQELRRMDNEILRIRGEEKKLVSLKSELEAERSKVSTIRSENEVESNRLVSLRGIIKRSYFIMIIIVSVVLITSVLALSSNTLPWVKSSTTIIADQYGSDVIQELIRGGHLQPFTLNWYFVITSIAITSIIVWLAVSFGF